MPKVVKLPVRKKDDDDNNVQDDGRLIKYITFFGDSAIPEDSDIYKTIWEAAKLLALNGYGIVNGGGPGVMKAATDGAESVGGNTVAIYWEPRLASLFEGKNITNLTDESQSYSNYMMRTLGLIEKAQVYVCAIGGTGTVSEFGMVWALAKIYFGKHKPVILFGKFWKDLIASFQKNMLIDDKELGVLHYAETKEDLLDLIKSFELEIQSRTKRMYDGDESAFVISASALHTERSYNDNAQAYHRERVGKLVSQDQLDEFIKMVNPPAQVLDIGCGPGYDLNYLSKKYSVTGIDSSKEMVSIAKFENPGSEIVQGNLLTIDLPENNYKGIWARDVIHHIAEKDLKFTFRKLNKLLVDQGVLYLIVREGEGERVEEETRAGHTLKRFYHYFSDTELISLAEKCGFELIKLAKTERSHKWINAAFKKVK